MTISRLGSVALVQYVQTNSAPVTKHSGLEFEFAILAPFLPSDGHKNFKVPITPSGLFLEQVGQPEAAPKNLAKPSPYPVQTLWRLP